MVDDARDTNYPGAIWCPICGDLLLICPCPEDKINRWAWHQIYGDYVPITFEVYRLEPDDLDW